jgi:phosphoribosylglycinamide formyltransferase-1
MRVAVFISGAGSNLQALIDDFSTNDNSSIALVIADSYKKAEKGIVRARTANIPAWIVKYNDYPKKKNAEEQIQKWLDEYRIDFIVLAGYMKILSPEFVTRWNKKLINLHPSLLPAFPGATAIQESYDYGVKVAGVTVHYVDSGVDTGEIIDQMSFRVPDNCSIEEYEKEIHSIEHALLPKVAKKLIS